MPCAFLLIEPSVWQSFKGELYYPPNYDSEGFIHLSYSHQLTWAANKFYAKAEGVLALEINLDALGPFVQEEPASSMGLFPHLHCGLPVKTIVTVHQGSRNAEGQWVFESV